MDRHKDSIGSCMANVGAESSDTADIKKYNDNSKDTNEKIKPKIEDSFKESKVLVCNSPFDIEKEASETLEEPRIVESKKPSYLKLACCVNGYYSINTYDSKIRQNLRGEAHRLSLSQPPPADILNTSKNLDLNPPPLSITMPNMSYSGRPIPDFSTQKAILANNKHNHNHEMGKDMSKITCSTSKSDDDCKKTLGIVQERVERLYGSSALAQAFYSPKKIKESLIQQRQGNDEITELRKKFQELSPSKNYNEFNKKITASTTPSFVVKHITETSESSENKLDDLPVLRHLSQEFRAQLPRFSPKRQSVQKISLYQCNDTVLSPTQSLENKEAKCSKNGDEVDHKHIEKEVAIETITEDRINAINENSNKLRKASSSISNTNTNSNNVCEKNGIFFLKALNVEKEKLLERSKETEKYIDLLTNNPNVTEDVLGLLRSVSGKARLLVSQKMKQFEGLCHNNMNQSPEDSFPTTNGDLEGFWDMIYIQIVQLNASFDEIEALRTNDWKNSSNQESESLIQSVRSSSAKPTRQKPPANSPKSTPSSSVQKREAQRKQLLELKKEHKKRMLKLAEVEANNTNEARVDIEQNCS